MVQLTPVERIQQHHIATNSQTSGDCFGLQWFVYDKVEAPKEIPKDSILCTKLLSNTVFSKSEYAFIFLDVYKQLESKIRQFYKKDQVHIHIKGSAALSMYFMDDEEMSHHFPFSDIDIVIYVNPTMPNFEYVHKQMTILAGQTFAKHKQMLDRLFFRTSKIAYEDFTEEVNRKFTEMNLISPFQSTQVRNRVSSNSFSIIESAIDSKKVVKINEAHFDCAEKIPLYRTPIVCSVNKTIDSKNLHDEKLSFNLIRMKMGAIGSKGGNVLFDCVDCIIPKIDDHDLISFYKKNGFGDFTTMSVNVFDYDVTIQTITESFENLWNLIYKYECPDSKNELRINKLDILKEYITGAKNN